MGKENGQIEEEKKKREGGRNDEGNHEASNWQGMARSEEKEKEWLICRGHFVYPSLVWRLSAGSQYDRERHLSRRIDGYLNRFVNTSSRKMRSLFSLTSRSQINQTQSMTYFSRCRAQTPSISSDQNIIGNHAIFCSDRWVKTITAKKKTRKWRNLCALLVASLPFSGVDSLFLCVSLNEESFRMLWGRLDASWCRLSPIDWFFCFYAFGSVNVFARSVYLLSDYRVLQSQGRKSRLESHGMQLIRKECPIKYSCFYVRSSELISRLRFAQMPANLSESLSDDWESIGNTETQTIFTWRDSTHVFETRNWG